MVGIHSFSSCQAEHSLLPAFLLLPNTSSVLPSHVCPSSQVALRGFHPSWMLLLPAGMCWISQHSRILCSSTPSWAPLKSQWGSGAIPAFPDGSFAFPFRRSRVLLVGFCLLVGEAGASQQLQGCFGEVWLSPQGYEGSARDF